MAEKSPHRFAEPAFLQGRAFAAAVGISKRRAIQSRSIQFFLLQKDHLHSPSSSPPLFLTHPSPPLFPPYPLCAPPSLARPVNYLEGVKLF